MAKEFENISADLVDWIARQNIFFVATAPLSGSGHLNCSPKGGDSFRVTGPMEAVYQDYTGSGAETAAHVRENGRIVIMFCAFEGPPRIVRLHGLAELILPVHARYLQLQSLFPSHPGTRAFIRIDVFRVTDSCGFAVPLYDFRAPRETLDQWSRKRTPTELRAFRIKHGQRSIDGLPAFEE